MSSLAATTPTFLFTDIEGSTRLWEESAELMRLTLVRHDALAGAILLEHSGALVKSRGEGDSLFAVFDSARDGVMAACALQAAYHSEPWPGGRKLRVRMALHRGTAEIRDEDYYGPTINRCARLRAVGHGGQILISHTVFDALAPGLPEGYEIRDMGRHRLKDLQQPEQVYQVCPPDVPQDFPPLLSLNYVQHNLPIQPTTFVGRDREIAELRAMLERAPAITLVGTGGSGKSRLALQAAADRMDRAVDGVWIVDLAPVSDPELVAQAVASVLGLRENPEEALLQTLCNFLKPRTTVLVLDNCEHLLASCGAMVEAIIRSCPNARILATSRERLGFAGERLYPVPALALPPAQTAGAAASLDPSQLLQFAAVRLFCERAHLQQPDFALTAGNARDVVQICRKLDGMPLALELAAARVRSLPPSQIVVRLDDRFRILKGGSRTALPRQQTLEALIDWSYDLLSPPEKTLLQNLTVFSGGWTLPAAEEIVDVGLSDGAEADHAAEIVDLLDLLTSLVDKSLVVFSGEDEGGRYRLLETIRHYAVLKRAGSTSFEEVASRHTGYFLQLARDAEPHLQGPNQADWMARLEQDHDNLRAALSRCLPEGRSPSDPLAEQGLELCGVLWWFWYVRGYLKEGRMWLERALASNPAPSEARAEALTGLGMLAQQSSDLTAAESAYNDALEIRRGNGDPRGVAMSLGNLGTIALENRHLDQARNLYQESLALCQTLEDTNLLARAWNNLGAVATLQGELIEARNLYVQCLGCLRANGDTRSIAVLLSNLAELALNETDFSAAEEYLEECLTISGQVGDKFVQAYAAHMLGTLAYQTHREQAALRLWGSSHSALEVIGATLNPAEEAALEAAKLFLKERLGETQYASLWQAGRSLPLAEAVTILHDAISPQIGI